MCRRQALQHIIAGFEQLIRRDGERRAHKLKPALLGHTARLGQTQGIARATATGSVGAQRCHAGLPVIAVLPCLDELDVAIGTPPAQLVQAALPFIARLNIGVGPADRGLKPLLAQQANRLKRAWCTARMQQQRLHRHLLTRNDFLIPVPEKSFQKDYFAKKRTPKDVSSQATMRRSRRMVRT